MVCIAFHGDMFDVLPTLDADSFDSGVTDPPYGLKFMGKHWDHGVPSVEAWKQILRVLKPGAHLVCFGGTRTFHRLACAIEDAGFEIRDTLCWLYGQGFPKSLDVSKAIDKHFGAEREVTGQNPNWRDADTNAAHHARWNDAVMSPHVTAPATPEAITWSGWGSNLKPSYEPIILARKPLIGSIVENVLEHGTGSINVDACRIPGGDPANLNRLGKSYGDAESDTFGQVKHAVVGGSPLGRWPPNLLLDGSDQVIASFPQTKSGKLEPWHDSKESSNGSMSGKNYVRRVKGSFGGDEGSAARFFPQLPFSDDELRLMYCAKAGKRDRAGSAHPTVKPIALLKWLVRLITPPGGAIIDPFAGTGTTAAAAHAEGFDSVLVEQEAEYFADIHRRMSGLDIELIMVPEQPQLVPA